MIKVHHNNKDFRVFFSYYHKSCTPEHVKAPIKLADLRYTRHVKCHLQVKEGLGDNWGDLAIADVGCDSRDQFVREKGRKEAFTRTLNGTFMYKETRTVFWREYEIQTNKKWGKRSNLRPLRETGVPEGPGVQEVAMQTVLPAVEGGK